jgi:hypothetical protein
MTIAKRNRPSGGTRTASKSRATDYSHSSLHRAEDGYQAPTPEDRAVQAAIATLRGYGYGIAMRCLDCHHPITTAASIARMRGPRCAAKAVVDHG